MSPMSKKTTERIEFLDVLRGVAALYTVIFHLALAPNPRLELPNWLASFVYFGYSGVMLFFVISGFSLSMTMPRHLNRASPYLSYFFSRFFRIAPLFYFMIIISIIRDTFLYNFQHSLMDIICNFTFTFNVLTHGWISIVSAGWTIGVEMIFYFIFPWFFKRTKVYENLFIALAASLLLSTIFAALVEILIDDFTGFPGRGDFVRGNFFSHLPTFIVGMLVFKIYSDTNLTNLIHKWKYFAIGIGFLGLAMSMIKGGPGDPLLSAVDNSFQLAAIYGILIIGMSSLVIKGTLWKFAQNIGRISYSLYLCHYTIISFMNPLYIKIYSFHLSSILSFTLCLVLTLIIVLPVAMIAYRFIERPCINIGEELTRRFAE